jgi:hypothetical protein
MALQTPMPGPGNLSPDLEHCVEACLACYRSCMGMAMNYCLERGGRHVEPGHFRVMMACAEMCRTAASFLLMGTVHYRKSCAECADICEECAESCAALDGMEHCVAECRRCAAECREAAAMTEKAA